MALVPLIQPPIMRVLTTDKERVIEMEATKKVTRKQKLVFSFTVTLATLPFVPAAGTLIAMLMLGNLIRESGVTERYVRLLQNDRINLITLLIGVSVGATAVADQILTPEAILVIGLGLFAFASGTVGGILIAKLLCKITGGKVNPLLGMQGYLRCRWLHGFHKG